MKPKLSLIIVNYHSEDALADCLRSIHVATKEEIEVILVDNSSGGEADRALHASGLHGHYFPQSSNTGYTWAANFGARHASGKFLCFLNPDTILEAHALDRMLAWVEQHPQTVVGPREVDANGQILTSVFPYVTRRYIWGANLLYRIPWPRAWHPEIDWLVPSYRYAHLCRTAVGPEAVPVLSGSCLLLSQNVWETVGEWNQKLTYFGLESEWFHRAKGLGMTAWYLPDAKMFHVHGLSIKRSLGNEVRNEAESNRRWHAAQKGVITLAILALILWIEHRIRSKK